MEKVKKSTEDYGQLLSEKMQNLSRRPLARKQNGSRIWRILPVYFSGSVRVRRPFRAGLFLSGGYRGRDFCGILPDDGAGRRLSGL